MSPIGRHQAHICLPVSSPLMMCGWTPQRQQARCSRSAWRCLPWLRETPTCEWDTLQGEECTTSVCPGVGPYSLPPCMTLASTAPGCSTINRGTPDTALLQGRLSSAVSAFMMCKLQMGKQWQSSPVFGILLQALRGLAEALIMVRSFVAAEWFACLCSGKSTL